MMRGSPAPASQLPVAACSSDLPESEGAYGQRLVHCPFSPPMSLGSDATYGHAGMPLYPPTMS